MEPEGSFSQKAATGPCPEPGDGQTSRIQNMGWVRKGSRRQNGPTGGITDCYKMNWTWKAFQSFLHHNFVLHQDLTLKLYQHEQTDAAKAVPHTISYIPVTGVWVQLGANPPSSSSTSRPGARGSFPGGKVAGGVKLTTHLHLMQRLKMREVIPPLPNTPSWCSVRSTGTTFCLYLPGELQSGTTVFISPCTSHSSCWQLCPFEEPKTTLLTVQYHRSSWLSRSYVTVTILRWTEFHLIWATRRFMTSL